MKKFGAMALIAMSLLFLSVLSVPAWSVETLTVTVDKTIYARGELVEVSGSVTGISTEHDVSIQILKPGGSPWSYAQVTPASNGSFQLSVARLSEQDPLGLYEITVSYRGDHAKTTFFLLELKNFNAEWQGQTFPVRVLSDASVTDFQFDQPSKQIRITVEATASGFVNMTLANELLSAPYDVTVDGTSEQGTTFSQVNQTHTKISTIFNTGSHTITVVGTNVIPEFPISTFLTMAVGVGILLVAFRFRRRLTNTGDYRTGTSTTPRSFSISPTSALISSGGS